ncbi:MAG TPA: GcrA family cell cycle regulator [Aestuariivirgaceae bacterium]|nr:GcrA family cell cycle regulator [Aestuariivirgaceae bacterium]
MNEEPANTTPNDKMPWTDDRVEQLKRMWSEGLTASQIAARIGQGVTRNAVIGKVHRLGLSGRVAKVRSPQPKPPRKIYEPNLAARERGLPVSGATALKPQFRPQPKPLPEVEPEPIRLVEVPTGEQRCSIMHLTDRTCRWPIGDPTAENFCFCGSTPREKGPYCEYHARIAYQPLQDRRRGRARG